MYFSSGFPKYPRPLLTATAHSDWTAAVFRLTHQPTHSIPLTNSSLIISTSLQWLTRSVGRLNCWWPSSAQSFLPSVSSRSTNKIFIISYTYTCLEVGTRNFETRTCLGQNKYLVHGPRVRVRVRSTLRLAFYFQSVSSWCQAPWGSRLNIVLTQSLRSYSSCNILSDERMGLLSLMKRLRLCQLYVSHI
jgi:hypothetical protein